MPAGKREEARAALARLEPAFAEPDGDRVRQWLGSLGVLTAGGRMTAEDARAKGSAYAAMLDYPAGCYTKDALRAVARALAFFPSFAELCGALDKEKARLWRTRNRLEALIKHQPPPRAVLRPRSAETQAVIDAALGKLTAKIVSADEAEAEHARKRAATLERCRVAGMAPGGAAEASG